MQKNEGLFCLKVGLKGYTIIDIHAYPHNLRYFWYE
jgi:hypothetical protein